MVDAKVKPFLLLVTLGLLLGCRDREVVEATPVKEPAVTEPAPAPVLPLGRALMIAAAASAADAYSSGRPATGIDPLVGRRFSISLPFGCGGASPVATEAPGHPRAIWQDTDRKAVVLTVTPDDWTGSALVTESGAKWESVEGYWIDRAWLLQDRCPAVKADPLQTGAVTPEAPSIGLANVHAEGASRLGRRDGRTHRFVIRGGDGSPPPIPADGWRVRLEGRIDSFPDGRAFRCRATGPDARPTCVAAVTLDHVAFEDVSGAVLSEWRPA